MAAPGEPTLDELAVLLSALNVTTTPGAAPPGAAPLTPDVSDAADKDDAKAVHAALATLRHIAAGTLGFATDVTAGPLPPVPAYHDPVVFARCLGDTRAVAAVQFTRKMTSKTTSPPLAELVAAGVPTDYCRLIHCCSAVPDNRSADMLCFEAAWALTNIASGDAECTAAAVQAGALVCFAEMLDRTAAPDCIEQAIWGLGNIAGDGSQARDAVLALPHNVLSKLVGIIRLPDVKLAVRRNAIWTISNLCRGKPPPPAELFFPPNSIAAETALQCLALEDDEVRADALWGLSYLADIGDVRVSNGLVQLAATVAPSELAALCNNPHVAPSVVVPLIRFIGNLLSSTSDDATVVLVAMPGVLSFLIGNMQNPRKAVRAEAFWALSNVAASAGAAPAQLLPMVKDLLPAAVAALQDPDARVRQEAAWLLANALDGAMSGHGPDALLSLYGTVIPPLLDVYGRDQNPKLQTAVVGALVLAKHLTPERQQQLRAVIPAEIAQRLRNSQGVELAFLFTA